MIRTTKADLARAAKAAASACDPRSSMLVLGHVLVEPERITGTALTLTVASALGAEGDGRWLLPGRDLARLAAALPDGPVTIEPDGLGAVIRAGRSRRVLPGLDPADWPQLDSEGAPKGVIRAEPDVLAAALRSALVTAAEDEARPHMAGVHVGAGPDGVRVVSTDGHRLTVVALVTTGTSGSPTMLLPRAGVSEMVAAAESSPGVVELRRCGGYAVLETAATRVTARLPDEMFPPWSRVIPSGEATRDISVSGPAMRDALKRLRLVGDGVEVRVTADGVEMRCRADTGESVELVDADAEPCDVAWGLNARYLADAVAACGDDVRIALRGELAPVVLTGGATTAVVMPMRI